MSDILDDLFEAAWPLIRNDKGRFIAFCREQFRQEDEIIEDNRAKTLQTMADEFAEPIRTEARALALEEAAKAFQDDKHVWFSKKDCVEFVRALKEKS